MDITYQDLENFETNCEVELHKIKSHLSAFNIFNVFPTIAQSKNARKSMKKPPINLQIEKSPRIQSRDSKKRSGAKRAPLWSGWQLDQ